MIILVLHAFPPSTLFSTGFLLECPEKEKGGEGITPWAVFVSRRLFLCSAGLVFDPSGSLLMYLGMYLVLRCYKYIYTG